MKHTLFFAALALAGLFCLPAASACCTEAERTSLRGLGDALGQRLYDLGGLWVDQSGFESKVMQNLGLSRSCAHCYAVAYTCGKDNCKSACWLSYNQGCRQCALDHGCTGASRQCVASECPK